ncbi:MAG: FecR family protein [Blastocatellia bacterium]|nr:FecR family protein [Blastocatellia bacterium]
MKLCKIALTTMVILMASTWAYGQERNSLPPDEQSQYVVSAKAGQVNFIEGQVLYKRLRNDWDILTAGDNLLTGDSVKTGVGANAEILLNPGSYLRLSEKAEFIFSNASLYSLKLNLLKGSAIVESAVVEEPITVITPNAEYMIVERGLYRFDVMSDERSEVMVRKGRVLVADAKVKKGKKAVIEDGDHTIAKFNSKLQDEFDLWSKDRAKTLIAANKRLQRNTLRSVLANNWYYSMWLYDRRYGYCTFLPGYRGYSSPYGWGYSSCNPYGFRNYWGPQNNYGAGYRGGNNGNTGGGNTGGGGRARRPDAPDSGGRGRVGGDRPRPVLPGPGRTGGGSSVGGGRTGGGVSAPSAPRSRPSPSMPSRSSPSPSSGGGRSRSNNN